MMNGLSTPVLMVLGAAWMLLLAGTAVLALTDLGGKLRPTLLRAILFLVGVEILVFGYLTGRLAILAPVALVVVAVNMWRLRFCPHCQKLNGSSLQPPRFCERCGKPMRPTPTP